MTSPILYYGYTPTKAHADLEALWARSSVTSVFNVLDYGAGADLTGDLSAAMATIFTKLPLRGGRIIIPPGLYRALSPISPPGRNVLLDGGRIAIEFDAGAIVYSYDTTAGRSLFDLATFVSQDSQLLIRGGIFDGTNASSTSNGINVHADNVTLADLTVRNFRGDGIKFTNDLAAPPIRCELRHVISFLNGRGIVSDGASSTGLLMHTCTVEGSDREGVYLNDAGTVTMIDCIAENNGHVVTTKENLVVLGSTSFVGIGCDFEDDANQSHTSVRVDGTAHIMPEFVMIGGNMTGYQVAGAVGFDIGASGTVRNVIIEGVSFSGHLTGIKLGTFVQGYRIGVQNWSDSYDPVTGAGTRIVNNATGNGVINKLDRFNYSTDGYEIHGRLSTTDDVTFGAKAVIGKDSSDQAVGAGVHYRPHRVKGRVSAGAVVRSDVESAVANTAMLNVVAGTVPVFPAVALAGAGAGNVDNGAHSYKITFVDALGESTGGPASAVTVVDKTANGQVALTSIAVGNSPVTARKVYRTKVGGTAYFLVGTIADNATTTFTDNIADASLGAAMPATSTTADLGAILSKLALGIGAVGTVDAQPMTGIAGNVEQMRWDTTGLLNSRLGYKVAGVQVLTTQQASAAQAAVVLGNADNAIGGLTISAAYSQAEVTALRNACETLADDVRALSVLIHAMRTAGVTHGHIKGSA